jgi:hypothetical protein
MDFAALLREIAEWARNVDGYAHFFVSELFSGAWIFAGLWIFADGCSIWA